MAFLALARASSTPASGWGNETLKNTFQGCPLLPSHCGHTKGTPPVLPWRPWQQQRSSALTGRWGLPQWNSGTVEPIALRTLPLCAIPMAGLPLTCTAGKV
jgi:hypothetical protein